MASKTKQESGFEEFEKLLETEGFQHIHQGFTAAYEQLEKINKAHGGLGKTLEARKAMKAIERVMDLFRDLAGDSTPQRKK